MSQNNNQEAAIKSLGIISLAVIIFALLYNSLMGGTRGFGFQMSHGMGYGMGYGYGAGSANFNGILASLLVLAWKLLWLILLGALLAGIVIFIKKYLNDKVDLSVVTKLYPTGCNCPSCGTKITQGFKFCPGCRVNIKESCAVCGRKLLPGWKCCPDCGHETGVAVGHKVQEEIEYQSTGTRLSHEDNLI